MWKPIGNWQFAIDKRARKFEENGNWQNDLKEFRTCQLLIAH
jgi:hypothetical protein